MYNLLIIAVLIIVVLLIILIIEPMLSAKKVNIAIMLEKATQATEVADKALAIARDILPNNSAIGILTVIEKWAKIAVGNAEQLGATGAISLDDRAQVAESVVMNVLNSLNILVDDNKKILIKAAIEEAVLNLGHKPEIIVAPLLQ